MIALLILGFVLPVVIWLATGRLTRTIYRGKATALPATVSIGRSPSQHCFVTVLVPGLNGPGSQHALIAEIPLAQASKIGETPLEQVPEALAKMAPVEVDVVVRQGLGRPYVHSLLWPGETIALEPDTGGAELVVSFIYLALGIAVLFVPLTLWAGVYFMASGFVLGDRIARRNALHAGNRLSLAIMCPMLAVASFVLFTNLTVLTFVLGLPLAFSFGQVAGMLVGSFNKSRRVSACP